MMSFKNSPIKGSSLGSKASIAVNVLEGVKSIYGTSKELYSKHFLYTVSVSEKDSLYSEVLEWLVAVLPNEKHKSVTVWSSRSNSVESSDPSDRAEKVKPLMVRFNENTTRRFTIAGHTVNVTLTKPEISTKPENYYEAPLSRIEFAVTSYAAQQAVIAELEAINARRGTVRKANLKMVSSWGSWQTRSDLPPRTIDSVSLPADQKNRIISDLAQFLEAEEQYNRLAIPWHRGYMFYGPPGTGKTSLVKALANEFNLDLWYIGLAGLTTEASLMNLVSEVGPRSLLLLEDIDTLPITHKRDGKSDSKINMSSLLNALDGVTTPHGLITIMTTNRFEVLDPALTRAGRMDLIEKLDYPSGDTLAQMFKHFYGVMPKWTQVLNSDTWHIPIEGLSTSQVAEIMKRNMTDPKNATKEIAAAVKEALKG